MIIGELMLRRLPLRGYPDRYQVREPGVGMRMRYTLADVCVLTEAEAAGLRAAGIQSDMVDLIRAGLHPDKTQRPSLSDFRDGIINCLEPCVSRALVSVLNHCYCIHICAHAYWCVLTHALRGQVYHSHHAVIVVPCSRHLRPTPACVPPAHKF